MNSLPAKFHPRSSSLSGRVYNTTGRSGTSKSGRSVSPGHNSTSKRRNNRSLSRNQSFGGSTSRLNDRSLERSGGGGEDSFWSKIGTFGRKSRRHLDEVVDVEIEGKRAIDLPGQLLQVTLSPEDCQLEDNEQRSMIEPDAWNKNKSLHRLIRVLIEWLNDELHAFRIIVKDLEQDIYDGQVLQKLMEKLTGKVLSVAEVSQSEDGQRRKLGIILDFINIQIGLDSVEKVNKEGCRIRWSVDSIHTKNIVSIIHLLVALVRHYRAPIRLPENVCVEVLLVSKVPNSPTVQHKVVQERLTADSYHGDWGQVAGRTVTDSTAVNTSSASRDGAVDVFDALLALDVDSEKVKVVKKSLTAFVNSHLSKLSLEVFNMDIQFTDGVFLCMLCGLLQGFFVPFWDFYLTPQCFDERVSNVTLAFDLMEDDGVSVRPKTRPEDIVNGDIKSTLRVVYTLFSKYKNVAS